MRNACKVLAFLFLGAPAFGAELMPVRKGEVPASGLYVPVPLEAQARDSAGVALPNKHVTVGGVPFDLVDKPGADNLFLKSAEWPDWKKDPSDYYAPYDSGPEVAGDPRRPMFKVPVADYSAVYLLAAADNDRALSNVISFRVGAMNGPHRLALHDFSGAAPRFDEKGGPGAQVAIPTGAGNVYMVRVPLGLAIAQDFKDEWALDVEVTKELRLAVRRPDPCRYQIRPLGLPSGVHIFAMTFARSPLQMEVTSDEAGHVFVEPQAPTFHVRLREVEKNRGKFTLEATATDYEGTVTSVDGVEVKFGADGRSANDVTLPVKRRGYHALTVRLMSGKSEVLRRETTFALLPPDTRKHRADSPFGTWDFSGGHYTPSEADVVGPLYVKAGLRYGMFGFTAAERAKYGVLAGNEPRDPATLAKALEKDPTTPKRILIFHENAISGPHMLRTPDAFTGRSPYQLDEKEQAKFDAMWAEAITTATATRKQYPDAKIAFGNGTPHLMEAFARRKFPAELFDSRGNEAGSYMRMPETQPLDYIANNASLWMDRQILNAYGYAEKPITQCYEICYPNTNPGNLSLATQASYYVRHMLHSLAWGVPVIRPGCITDMGNSYYHSMWGASGFCFAKPDVRPKPSYVAVATLTRVLDGASLVREAPTGSPVVYAMEFKRREGGRVTAMWTIRGKRALTLAANEANAVTLTDMMGNERTVKFADGKAEVVVSSDPVFVATVGPLSSISAGAATMEGRPKGKSFAVSPLDKLADWQVETERSAELEWYNFECPRRLGNFAYENAAEFEGEKAALKVTPRLPVAGSGYLPMYGVLSHKAGVEIPGQPTEIGLMVSGNGGWGRIIFELQDAEGQRWISIGAAMTGEASRWMADWLNPAEMAAMKGMSIADWNTNDPWQRSRINFEGWRYVKFPLPGNYPGEGYHWPYSSQWRCTGDGVVKYPLTFEKLVIEMPEKALYLKTYAPVSRPEIYLKDLRVTYEAPEKAFVAE